MEENKLTAEIHNRNTLESWAAMMNKEQEAILFSIAINDNSDLNFYTTLKNKEQVERLLIRSLKILQNSKPINLI